MRDDKAIVTRRCGLQNTNTDFATAFHIIYIIKEKLETLTSMESYLPTSDRHVASWIFSDGPSKQLGVVKLRYNTLKLFFYNVAILRQRACFRQRLSLAAFLSSGKTAPLTQLRRPLR